MFKGRIAFKLTAGFVVIVLVSMMTIGILFIQMFQQYTFDSREQTMLSRARSIAEVVNSALSEIMNRPQPYLNEDVEKDLNDLEIEAQLTKVMEEKKILAITQRLVG